MVEKVSEALIWVWDLVAFAGCQVERCGNRGSNGGNRRGAQENMGVDVASDFSMNETIIERGVSRRGDATKGQDQEEGKALIKSYG